MTSSDLLVSEDVSRRMRNTPRRDTPAELAIRQMIHRRGLRYRVDVSPEPGMRSRADMVFTAARVVVFVDGCFWHGCPTHMTWPTRNGQWWRDKIRSNQRRDRRVTRDLASRGWRVVRIWEHEDPAEAADRIVRHIAP